jgi:hypothetical protein
VNGISLNLELARRDISGGPSFKRRNVKEDNKDGVEIFLLNVCLTYMEDNCSNVLKEQGDVTV